VEGLLTVGQLSPWHVVGEVFEEVNGQPYPAVSLLTPTEEESVGPAKVRVVFPSSTGDSARFRYGLEVHERSRLASRSPRPSRGRSVEEDQSDDSDGSDESDRSDGGDGSDWDDVSDGGDGSDESDSSDS